MSVRNLICLAYLLLIQAMARKSGLSDLGLKFKQQLLQQQLQLLPQPLLPQPILPQPLLPQPPLPLLPLQPQLLLLQLKGRLQNAPVSLGYIILNGYVFHDHHYLMGHGTIWFN